MIVDDTIVQKGFNFITRPRHAYKHIFSFVPNNHICR